MKVPSAECRVLSGEQRRRPPKFASCWAFAVARLRAVHGVRSLPADFGEALGRAHALAVRVPKGSACRAGDLVFTYSDNEHRDHVLVAISAFEAVHYSVPQGRVLLARIAPLRAGGRVRFVARSKELLA